MQSCLYYRKTENRAEMLRTFFRAMLFLLLAVILMEQRILAQPSKFPSDKNMDLEKRIQIIQSVINSKKIDKQQLEAELQILKNVDEEKADVCIYSLQKIFNNAVRLYQKDKVKLSQIEPVLDFMISKQSPSPETCGVQIDALAAYLLVSIKNEYLDTKQRKIYSDALLRLWRCITIHCEENDTLEQKKRMEPYFPPVEEGFNFGQDPKYIKDEKFRKEYSDYLKYREDCNKKNIQRNQSKWLVKTHNETVRELIINMYSVSRKDDELIELLKQYSYSEKEKIKILETLKIKHTSFVDTKQTN